MPGRRIFDTLRGRSPSAPGARGRQALPGEDVPTATSLGELRARTGLTQVQLAERLERSQAQVSRIEHGRDPHLSTVVEYVDGLGGRLDLVVTLPDGSTVLVDLQGAGEARTPGGSS